LIHKLGANYHFFFATPNSIARIQSNINPFYPFLKVKPTDLPSISSDPILVPKFIYEIDWNRNHFATTSISLPAYITYSGKEISIAGKWPPYASYMNTKDESVKEITSSPFPAPSKLPFFIRWEEKEKIQIGGIKQNESLELSVLTRTKYESAKYLSLRDIVNPTLSEEEILEKIENLYFDKKSKAYLYRLVKILYAGTPEEEYKIISNLFSDELEFAKFLSQSIFTAEIIPMIHGPFLQSFIGSFDERYIRYVYPKLSSPVKTTLQKSVSKGKLQMILDSPSLEPKYGEGFVEKLEEELYKKFSRNIYYVDGSFKTYREKIEESDHTLKFFFEDSKKVNFWQTGNGITFFGLTKHKLFFRTEEWIQNLRFDWFLSRKEWEPIVFHRLPPGLILEIPFYSTGKCVVGGGITDERKAFEFSLQWFEY